MKKIVTIFLWLLIGSGCANIGCKYDLRKYPTPIVVKNEGHHTHQWNPDACGSDGFDRMTLPGYGKEPLPQPTAPSAPKPLPVGPVKAAELSPPSWNDPLRGGTVTALPGN